MPQRADRLAWAGEGLADQLVEQEQPEQQRHVAERLDVPFADLAEQPVGREPADADQRAQNGAEDDAEDGDAQRVEDADPDRPGVGAGRRILDHRVADLEAGLASEIVETAGDLLPVQIVDGVADEIPGETGDETDDHDLKDPAADDRIVPGRHSHARRGAQCLDCHTLVPLPAAVYPHADRPDIAASVRGNSGLATCQTGTAAEQGVAGHGPVLAEQAACSKIGVNGWAGRTACRPGSTAN